MFLKPQLLRGLALGAVVLGMTTPQAQAQTPDRKTALSGSVGLLQYNGNMGSDFWNRSGNDLEVGGGATLTRYLSPTFDLALSGYVQSYQFSGSVPGNNFEMRGGMADLGIKLKLNNGKILKEDFFVQPYLMGGGGMFMFNSEGRANGRDFRNEIRRHPSGKYSALLAYVSASAKP
jgi:OOP family OmpA-OmpF porin